MTKYERYKLNYTKRFRSGAFKLLRKLLTVGEFKRRHPDATPAEIKELTALWVDLIDMAIHGPQWPPPGSKVEIRYATHSGRKSKKDKEAAEEFKRLREENII